MFNVGTGELMVILLVALLVLGPDKLPDTARKIGNVVGELRRMSQGFQDEVRKAMDDAKTELTPENSAMGTPSTAEAPTATPAVTPDAIPESAPTPGTPPKLEPVPDELERPAAEDDSAA
jgi:Tat protein translocase TatB subunit